MYVCNTIGLKNLRSTFIQSEVKPTPVETHLHTLSHALCQLHDCNNFEFRLVQRIVGVISDWTVRVITLFSNWFYNAQMKTTQ